MRREVGEGGAADAEALQRAGPDEHHPEPALRQLVILDPAVFLVAPASRIVCQHGFHELPEHVLARRKLLFDYRRLETRGLASRRLLRVLWGDRPAHQRDLELLMVRHGLMFPLLAAADAPRDDSAADSEEVLVPAVLPRPPAGGGEAALRAVGSDGAVSAVRAVVVFAEAPVMTSWRRVGYLSTAQAAGRGFLPAGLFAQVFLKLGGFTTIPVTKFTTAV